MSNTKNRRLFRYSQRNWLTSFLMIIAYAICISSCQTRVDQHPQEMTQFGEILTIDHHYAELAKLDNKPQAQFKNRDTIYFPNQANKLLIRSIQPTYLLRQEIYDIVPMLKHPANSSKQVRAELDFLLEIQANRSSKEIDEALRIHEIVYFPVIGMKSDKHLFFEAFEVFGSDFKPENYPQTKKLLHNIMKDMRVMEFSAKNELLRPRPRQLESTLSPLKKMKSSSFVSGHTLWAYLQGYLFANLIPSKRNEFLDLAYKIGYSREILGVHYPSDEEAARVLAYEMLNRMWDIDTFKEDYLLAKSEWNQK